MLTKAEVNAILERMVGVPQLVGQLLDGSGLRLSEGLRLRVKALDFAHHQIVVRDVKGYKGRITMLPTRSIQPPYHQSQYTTSSTTSSFLNSEH